MLISFDKLILFVERREFRSNESTRGEVFQDWAKTVEFDT
jgi:hypothetical protein